MTTTYEKHGATYIVFDEEWEAAQPVDEIFEQRTYTVPKSNMVKAQGFNYLRFGKLMKIRLDEWGITIYNDKNEYRQKKRVYSSWPNTWAKLKTMLGEDIITRTTADTSHWANQYFSDVYINERFHAVINGKVKFHDLLQVPKVPNEEGRDNQQFVRDMVITARIGMQNREAWAAKKTRWEVADEYEQKIEKLTQKQKDARDADAKLLAPEAKRWIEDGKPVKFRIVQDRQRTGLTHVDKEFAMRTQINTTKLSRISLKPTLHVGGSNWLHCDYKQGDGEELPIQVCLSWDIQDKCWTIKSAKPATNYKQFMKLEKQFYKDKDADEPYEYWANVFDKVIDVMVKDGSL